VETTQNSLRAMMKGKCDEYDEEITTNYRDIK
jgi:hypothetical protein